MDAGKVFQRICLGFLIVAAESGAADETADWLNEFYDSRGVCVSGTSVFNIVVKRKNLTVLLKADDKYVGRVKRGGEEIVQDWLALHCPLPMVAYSKVLKGRDVVVQIEGVGALSCAAYEGER